MEIQEDLHGVLSRAIFARTPTFKRNDRRNLIVLYCFVTDRAFPTRPPFEFTNAPQRISPFTRLSRTRTQTKNGLFVLFYFIIPN